MKTIRLSIMKTIKLSTMKTIRLSFIYALVLLGVACSNDDNGPEPVNEEEVITTMTIMLTNASGTVTLQTQDLDGDGPNAPELTISGPLTANSSYQGSVVLLNETESPAENITTEVAEEDEEHQFFYMVTGAISEVSYTDEDGNGNPVGITFTLTTGDAGMATLGATLRHEPKKPNNGTLADAGGETDITQTFNVTVE